MTQYDPPRVRSGRRAQSGKTSDCSPRPKSSRTETDHILRPPWPLEPEGHRPPGEIGPPS
jgi:hypothetical protein